MDQDSFRQLISSGTSQASRSQPRESLFTKKNTKASTKAASKNADEPAFKPRKVKKLEGIYRDRAAERREGEGNDYAQVEAVLEEFEKRTADQDGNTVDEQRRYLGGDSEHSVLVKGLDFALLQQNKAKEAMATDEDESLEQAYNQASSESTVPKKRTREDIIRELKANRAQQGGATVPQEGPALDKSKFKPIGFKPIGSSGEQKEEKKKKKKSVTGEGERKKKKRKVEALTKEKSKEPEVVPTAPASPAATPRQPSHLPEPEEPKPPEDFDIFAGVGEYEGIDAENDSDEEDENNPGPLEREEIVPNSFGGGWFASDIPAQGPAEAPVDSPPDREPSTAQAPPLPIEEGEASDEELTRLVPLSSSAVPSIKELLEMDDAAGAVEKKQKRKNKKKSGGGDGEGSKKLTAEAKANRDYQRLQSYKQKQGAPST
ncbi:hypothetical protein GYMLUDRAFT_243474 [Collybiopsis luxurians FD-317 M1]|uniref:RED-like N-terminal domain-containing protein n=1 Tax=Collybiopsis luxurians FD-317 M1 TaxID=944289 RepID=A0A0D0C0U7_9AGAR|nr:hypothetical protein GYMLUDRAFT_243474 [Collybiopsis luxurians FD-317 M1]